uniref:Ig-like domain-containing protein n=1 Tax=Heterorhabditis bacteriophora TaxID=37862 RepID=A0A1I7WRE9_HETBA
MNSCRKEKIMKGIIDMNRIPYIIYNKSRLVFICICDISTFNFKEYSVYINFIIVLIFVNLTNKGITTADFLQTVYSFNLTFISGYSAESFNCTISVIELFRFYVECIRGPDGLCQQSGRRKTLKCAVHSHPPATMFRWLKNGVVTRLNYHNFNTSARLIQDNFAALQSAAPFQAGNRIEMNQQINLGCQVEGNPRPVVFWKLRKTNGQIINYVQIVDASCAQGFEGQYQEVTDSSRGQPIPPNIVRLNALCSLRIANYSFSGQYWCSACSYVSQGFPECSPGIETPGTSTLNIQVIGPPMQSDSLPSIEQAPNSNSAILTVHYCAEPMPRPPREVIFAIDQNDLQVGQSWENFRFESTTQNNTVPNCYMTRLHISPVREEDQYRQITLKLQNQYGSKQIPVSLDALLGGGSTNSARFPGWLIVLLVTMIICTLLACCVAICVKREILCFNSKFFKKNIYSLNVRDNFYDVDASRLYASQSAEKRSSYHEGVNYAELNLTGRSEKATVLNSPALSLLHTSSFNVLPTGSSLRPERPPSYTSSVQSVV